jgi:catechol 2,3-dioxygenase-like lactoylglutathione lyase family enzyme
MTHMTSGSALSSSRAMALVGVSDLAQARAFYGGTLGLTIISADSYALVADVGGVRVRLTQAVTVQPADYTVLGFEVPDAQATLTDLAQAGVRFEHYPFLGTSQADDGLWQAPGGTRVAWFKDPDGNLLSISDAPAG